MKSKFWYFDLIVISSKILTKIEIFEWFRKKYSRRKFNLKSIILTIWPKIDTFGKFWLRSRFSEFHRHFVSKSRFFSKIKTEIENFRKYWLKSRFFFSKILESLQLRSFKHYDCSCRYLTNLSKSRFFENFDQNRTFRKKKMTKIEIERNCQKIRDLSEICITLRCSNI